MTTPRPPWLADLLIAVALLLVALACFARGVQILRGGA